MSEQNDNFNDVVVLVDLEGSKQGRVRQVTRGGKDVSPEEISKLSGKSKDAVTNALGTIGWVAKQARATLNGLDISERPAQMELEFGIQITAEAGVIVAKTETQIHITAKLVWKKDTEEKSDG